MKYEKRSDHQDDGKFVFEEGATANGEGHGRIYSIFADWVKVGM